MMPTPHAALATVPEEIPEAATAAARALHERVLEAGEPARDVVDMLHGKWLGHPLHPVLTDLVVGAWTLGAAADIAGELADRDDLRRAGDRLAAVGAAAAVPTAIAGLADFTTLPKPAGRTGTVHALLNTAALGLYGLSIRERNAGRRGRGLLYSLTSFGGVMFSAWLGGHLVYHHKVGVDHSDSFSEPDDWTRVLSTDELPDRTPKRVDVEDKPILLYREGDEVSAIGATCSHAGGPLDEGEIEDCRVTCPWHQSVFDVRDGRVVHGPATYRQPQFDARIREGGVEVRLTRT